MTIAVFDLDNCIANDLWRVKHIRADIPNSFEKFHKYHSLSCYDRAHNLPRVWGQLGSGNDILIVTSRPEWYRHITEEWLNTFGIKSFEMLMRPNDDNETHSKDLKPLLIKQAGISFSEIAIAYDDRDDVLDSYRAHGIHCEKLFITEIEGTFHV